MSLQRRIIHRTVRVANVDDPADREVSTPVRSEVKANLYGKKVFTAWKGRQLDPTYYTGRIVRGAPFSYSEGRKQKMREGKEAEFTFDELYELPADRARKLEFRGKPIDPMHEDDVHVGVILDQVWDEENRDMWIGFKFYSAASNPDLKALTGEFVHKQVKAGYYKSLSATTYEDCIPGEPEPVEVGALQVAVCEEGARDGTEIVDPNKSETPFRYRVIASGNSTERRALSVPANATTTTTTATHDRRESKGFRMASSQAAVSQPDGTQQPQLASGAAATVASLASSTSSAVAPMSTGGSLAGTVNSSTGQGQGPTPPNMNVAKPENGPSNVGSQQPQLQPSLAAGQGGAVPSMMRWPMEAFDMLRPEQQRQMMQQLEQMARVNQSQWIPNGYSTGMSNSNAMPVNAHSQNTWGGWHNQAHHQQTVRAGGNDSIGMGADASTGMMRPPDATTSMGPMGQGHSTMPNQSYAMIQEMFAQAVVDKCRPLMEQSMMEGQRKREREMAFSQQPLQTQQPPPSLPPYHHPSGGNPMSLSTNGATATPTGAVPTNSGARANSDWYAKAVQAVIDDPNIPPAERADVIARIGYKGSGSTKMDASPHGSDTRRSGGAPGANPHSASGTHGTDVDKTREGLINLAVKLGMKQAEGQGIAAQQRMVELFKEQSTDVIKRFLESEQRNERGKGRDMPRDREGRYTRRDRQERNDELSDGDDNAEYKSFTRRSSKASQNRGRRADDEDDDWEFADAEDVRGMPRKRTSGGGGDEGRGHRSNHADPMDTDDGEYLRFKRRVTKLLETFPNNSGQSGVDSTGNKEGSGRTNGGGGGIYTTQASRQSAKRRAGFHPDGEEAADEKSFETMDDRSAGRASAAKRVTTEASYRIRRPRYETSEPRPLPPEATDGEMTDGADEDPETIAKRIEDISKRLVRASISTFEGLTNSKARNSGQMDDNKGYDPVSDMRSKAEIFSRTVHAAKTHASSSAPNDFSPAKMQMLVFPNHPVYRELLMKADEQNFYGLSEEEKARHHLTFEISPDLHRNMLSSYYCG